MAFESLLLDIYPTPFDVTSFLPISLAKTDE